MKTTTLFLSLVLISVTSVIAQKSTNLVPKVDSKGHIYYDRKKIGSLTTEGSFNQAGKPITKVDATGNIKDNTGKVIGKAPKNGTFVYYINGTEENYTISEASHTGMCEVKNAKGEIVMLLHNNYKQQAACAVHCLHQNHCMPADRMEGHKH